MPLGAPRLIAAAAAATIAAAPVVSDKLSVSAFVVYTINSAVFCILFWRKEKMFFTVFFVSRSCTGSGGLDSAVLQLVFAVDGTTNQTSDIDKAPSIASFVAGSSVSLSSTLERSLPAVWVLHYRTTTKTVKAVLFLPPKGGV